LSRNGFIAERYSKHLRVGVEVIVNRNARHLGEASPLRRELLDAAARHGARVHETYSLAQLDGVARSLAASQPRAVVLAGGDGSTMEGLSALARAFPGGIPPIALAPGGSVATIARNLGMHGPERARCRHIVQAVCEQSAQARPVATLRVHDDAGSDRVGFIFGAGLVARFFDVYEAAPRQGIGPAAAIAARVLLGSVVGAPLARRVLSPVACRLEVDGEPIAAREWTLVLASVVRDVGLGVRATYRAGEGAAGFHVVASTLRARSLAAQVPRVLTGRPMGGADRVDVVARSLRVTFDGPGAYILDGDGRTAGDVRVELGPVVSLLVP
jgi:diacylglycerol kinase family enzyme